ncbi:hypothetical protein KIL84_004736 [Mauremys mutica]|uniref:Uncharacterized protein n=1 Tax=Mauremys mutica TaxID=74926 RepID=A0A9D3XMB0_9SAUR|nr:hypothetical protein KIL84_004736 [Mauremys mutica]
MLTKHQACTRTQIRQLHHSTAHTYPPGDLLSLLNCQDEGAGPKPAGVSRMRHPRGPTSAPSDLEGCMKQQQCLQMSETGTLQSPSKDADAGDHRDTVSAKGLYLT